MRINEGAQGNTKTGVTVQDGVTRRPSEPSINNIAQNSEIDKRQGTKNSEDDATVDWNGNREEPEARLSAADEGSDTRFSAADADDDSLGVDWIGSREENTDARTAVADGIDLTRYSGKDRVYMEAVKNGNTDEAAWMVEDAAKRAGFSHKGFHQTGADFTSFSTKNEVAGQFDDETPTGIFIKPTDEDIGLQSGTKQMPLYFKADNMLEFANREEIRKYWIENVQG